MTTRFPAASRAGALRAALAVAFAGVAGAAVAQGAQPAAAQAAKGDVAAGRSKASMCIGCHGIPDYRTAFPQTYRVPRIGGQTEGYIASSLRAYAKGERRHPSMQGIAKSLKEQDILDLAAYYAAQGAGADKK